MIHYSNISQGIFLSRPNRFLARIQIDGQEEISHVKNTGRCRELLIPGMAVWCQHHDDPHRKTRWSLVTVAKGARMVNIDSQVPNRLAAQWLASGGLGFVPEMIKPEQTYGDSRFDLLFARDGRQCYLEVKGVTLEENGVARFPDAPTERRTKHIRQLQCAASEGYGAYVLFVVQMDGIAVVKPNWDTDPVFSQTLCQASAHGVKVLAVQCAVTPDTIAVTEQIPVELR